MISHEIFFIGLLIISVFTGLATEAVKKFLIDCNINYRANVLAGIVALILSALVGIGYVVMMNVAITAQVVVCLIALMFMSWLCAMVGYDKVIQTISQFKTFNKERDSK